jgi:hypothetical protein
MPTVSATLAPGQCIILKSTPINTMIEETTPEINVNFFIIEWFKFAYSFPNSGGIFGINSLKKITLF